MNRKLKIKKQLLDQEKISFAVNAPEVPDGCIDCREACNPYGFPPECLEAAARFDMSRLGSYPHSRALYDAIIDYWKDQIDVERENILIADGSINALYVINNIFDTHGAMALGISPQFTDYYMHAEMLGIEYAPYQLEKARNYKFDPKRFIAMHYGELDTEREVFSFEGLPPTAETRTYNFIYIDNPNNPTGQCIGIEDMKKIVSEAEKFNITVIIDEAFGDFMDKSNSAVNLFADYHNLAVVRSLSKGYGLPGLRVGYIIAHKDLIRCMDKMVNPYMVGEFSREIGAEALKHPEFIEKCEKDFALMKGQLREALGCTEEHPGGTGRLHMAETMDSNPLLLLYHDDPEIMLRDEFLKRNVLAIDGNDFKGLSTDSARIRLPKIEDFPVLLAAVKELNSI